jgi:hypothetical protein
MKIVRIFALEKESLYTVQYENEEVHEWERLFTNWQDPEFLYNFFEAHKDDLESGFWGNINLEDAVQITVEEADELEAKILTLSQHGKVHLSQSLQTYFKPLHDGCYELRPLQKSKGYGIKRKSWLRIYAIRISSNIYIISGGAIKLTRTMNNRDHLLLELQKMKTTQQFLQENGFVQEEDFDFGELSF